MDGQRQHGNRDVLLRERVATDNLAAIRDVIDDRAVRQRLPTVDVQRVVLAVKQAATNAIRHATGVAEVTVWHDGTRLIAEIRDDGPVVPRCAWRSPAPLTGTGSNGDARGATVPGSAGCPGVTLGRLGDAEADGGFGVPGP